MTTSAAPVSPLSADATIGHNVHDIIWRRKINQRKFAAMLRISDSVLSKRLRGTSAWSAQDIFDAANALGVSPERLLAPVTSTLAKVTPEIHANGDGPDVTPRARGHLSMITRR